MMEGIHYNKDWLDTFNSVLNGLISSRANYICSPPQTRKQMREEMLTEAVAVANQVHL